MSTSTNPFASVVPPEIGPLELKKLGDESFNAKEYKKAIYCYSKALEFQPDNPILYANRSVCWGEMGQLKRALMDADAAIRTNPMYAKGHTRRGAALFAMKRYKDAVTSLQSSINIDPDDEQTKKALKIAKEKAEKNPEEDQSDKFHENKSSFSPRYKHLKEITDTIYENIVDRAFIPAYLPYRESLDDYLFHLTTEERRKILSDSRNTNKAAPSLAPEVISVAQKVLYELMASPEQLLKYLDSIAFFSLERRNGGKNIIDMTLVGPQEAQENPELMQKWMIYLAVETEFMKHTKQLDQSKITHPPAILSGELLTQVAVFIGEVNNRWLSLQEKESSHRKEVKIVSLLDQEALASTWKLVDLEAEFFVGYIKELKVKDLDASAFDIIQSLARDRTQAAILLNKPYSEIFLESLKKPEFTNRFNIAAIAAAHLSPELEANRLVLKKPVDKELYNYLLSQLLLEDTKNLKGKALHIAQAKHILEKKDITLLRALANFVLGNKRVAVDLSNNSSLLEIAYHALSIQLDKVNSKASKSKDFVFDDETIKISTHLLRIIAGFVSVRALHEKINSIGTGAVLHGVEVCSEPHLSNLGTQVYRMLTNPVKTDENDENELVEEIDSALNNMNVSVEDALSQEFPEPLKIAEVRKSLLKASDVWLNISIMNDGVRYISACNGEGTVYLCGYDHIKGRKKEHVFHGILYNVVLKEMSDAVIFDFDTFEEAEEYWVKKYSMLQRFWVRISTEAAALITNTLKDNYTGNHNAESKEVMELLLKIGDNKIPQKTLEEAYLDCIANRPEEYSKELERPFFWWREFVGARFVSEFQFGVGDMLDVGCGPVPKHLTFKPQSVYDVPPKPDNFLCYWIRQCAKNISYDPVHFEERIRLLLLHMALYFQGNIQTEETAKINMKNVVYNEYLQVKKIFKENAADPVNQVLTQCPLLCAMIERTAYFSNSNEIPIEGMANVFEKFNHNLEFPVEGMLRSINSMLPLYENFTEKQTNAIRDAILVKLKQFYNTNRKKVPTIEALSEMIRSVCSECMPDISGKHLTLITGYLSEMLSEFLEKVWRKIKDKSFDPMPIPKRPQFGTR